MMTGGVIERSEIAPGVTRLWCAGAGVEWLHDFAVHVLTEADMPAPGDFVECRSGRVFWDGGRRCLRQIGRTYDPTAAPGATVSGAGGHQRRKRRSLGR